MDIRITSFGPDEPGPDDAHIKIDLGQHFPAPYVDPSIRVLTARHRKVVRHVRRTPFLRQLLAATVAQAQCYARCPCAEQHSLHIAIGCADGRQRASVTAHLLARRLRRRGHQVELHHSYVRPPVAERAAA